MADDRDDHGIETQLQNLNAVLGRIADALEKQNLMADKKSRCPSCLGTSTDYHGGRCMRCGGTGRRSED